jgi:glutamate--cysteine ligase catalytic subunit
MGLLSLGTPLTWDQTKALADHVRDHGITQFLHTWRRWKDVTEGKGFLWGDEVSLQRESRYYTIRVEKH